jgi:hypothetical protein
MLELPFVVDSSSAAPIRRMMAPSAKKDAYDVELFVRSARRKGPIAV